ncbi:MAG: DUF418 domain-containing protein, partial [Actinobacteria bacterium]|nr:DUF418 domain-containing protein [Actinomycetota bacterium]
MSITQRDSFPDILRGFALFGIAMVNIPFFSISTFNGAESLDLTDSQSASVAFIVFSLFQAKFYLLFSFLFGYSAHYVLKGEKSNRRKWIGRSLGLVLLGLIHLTFFFHGDILFLYGVFGLLLTLLYFRKEKTLKVWAWVIYILTAVMFAALAALTYLGELAFAAKGKTFPGLESINSLDAALNSGGFFEIAAARFEFWLLAAGQAFLLQGPLVFVAFIVGVLVARKGGLAASLKPELMKKFAIWGLTLGLALQLLAGYIFIANEQAENQSLGLYLLALALNFLTAPLMSAGLVGGLWLLSQRWKLSLLSAAGRHSLSVYLGQSLVFSTLFSAWGFGLFQELSLLSVVLIAAATWLALALL